MNRTTVDETEIGDALHRLGLHGQAVAVHASLRSFGHVECGATTVNRALTAICDTVLMPAFCDIGRTNPPPDDRPRQNGWDYDDYQLETAGLIPFNPYKFDRSTALNIAEMGQIAADFLQLEGTVRSEHPSVSWAGHGAEAAWYVAGHSADDPNLPLKRLMARRGFVLLLGVDLASCTAVHLAEEIAGRRPFVRWVQHVDDTIRRVREYGCSDAFPRLAAYVETDARRCPIGNCKAVAYPIDVLVTTLSEIISSQPEITLCGRDLCRCLDAVKGGPIE